jgi:hypothetical protein
VIRVRFLQAKRYPHPDGRRREVGDVVLVDEDTGQRWSAGGIVELVKAAPAKKAARPKKSAKE